MDFRMKNYTNLCTKIRTSFSRNKGASSNELIKQLDTLLQVHQLEPRHLDTHFVKDYFFDVEELVKKLFFQIVKKVYPKAKIMMYPKESIQSNNLQGNYSVKLKPIEFIEITLLFNFYSKTYKEELDTFFRAFCLTNKLLVSPYLAPRTPDLEFINLKEEYKTISVANSIKSNLNRRKKSNSDKTL